MSAKIEITTTESFEEFRNTLADRNLITDCDIMLNTEVPLVINGDAPVYFSNCRIHILRNAGTKLSNPVISTEARISFDKCEFPGGGIVLDSVHWASQLDLISPLSVAETRVICRTGTWSVNVTGNADMNRSSIVGIQKAHDVTVFNWLPVLLNIYTAEYVHIHSIDTDETRKINLDNIDALRVEHVSGKKVIFNIHRSIIEHIHFTNVQVRLVLLRSCCVRSMRINSYTHIGLIGAYDSACHEYDKVPTSTAPSAMTNSIGFPEQDAITLYKAVYLAPLFRKKGVTRAILKMTVKPDARKHLGESPDYKIRVDEATPVQLYAIDPELKPIRKPLLSSIRSIFDNRFKYRMNRPAVPAKPFCTDDRACASGIHGFLTIEKAKEYTFR